MVEPVRILVVVMVGDGDNVGVGLGLAVGRRVGVSFGFGVTVAVAVAVAFLSSKLPPQVCNCPLSKKKMPVPPTNKASRIAATQIGQRGSGACSEEER